MNQSRNLNPQKPQANPLSALAAAIKELLTEVKISNILMSALLPSAPYMTSVVAVLTSPTMLIQNLSMDMVRVTITDSDPAQSIFVGGPGVTIGDGEELLAGNSVSFVLGRGQRLYGVCTIATVSCQVSQGFDFLMALRQVV